MIASDVADIDPYLNSKSIAKRCIRVRHTDFLTFEELSIVKSFGFSEDVCSPDSLVKSCASRCIVSVSLLVSPNNGRLEEPIEERFILISSYSKGFPWDKHNEQPIS